MSELAFPSVRSNKKLLSENAFNSALSRRAMKSVVAAQAAALAAWRVTSLGDRIGGIVFSENGLDEIRPRSRQAAIGPLFEAVVRHNRALGADDTRSSDSGLINVALAKALKLLPHDGLLTLITDAAGSDAQTVKLVTQISGRAPDRDERCPYGGR